MQVDLNIAEIPYETGETQYRYSRYLSSDGTKWVRHGLFRAYYRDGRLASEGHYVHGKEEGLWRDYHENGQLGAEGTYKNGEQVGEWRYWNDRGEPEQST